ncbi:hypothetical protein B6S12_04100 [Helicobacter valdiviensis]|uniref:Periplasmic protein n=1 Tax=Helicobacter valdiviensis TaxID=1458358 RepID=A0A2W6MVK7_9HELI|nr:hypothetical protein [Helicobacter valdiviensis]PZT48382.1 hypothetical protein B6S12_04100 [Helicobacter valdiviensis]
MKKLIFILCLLPLFVLAKSQYLSPLPLPESEVINLDTKYCSSSCLKNYYEDGLIFSFIANINDKNKTNSLLEILQGLLVELNITNLPYFTEKPTFKIALLIPRQTIGRYSLSATNTVLAYLLNQKNPFSFEVFDSKGEDFTQISQSLEEIKAKGFTKVIAIFTQNGIQILNQILTDLTIYIPSIHITQIDSPSPHLIFGGISYEEQIKTLSSLNPEVNATSFYDTSYVGVKIQEYTQSYNRNLLFSSPFNSKDSQNLNKQIKSIKSTLNGSRIFLNTPVTNSSILLSQITYNDINAFGIYSTQINYHPSFLSLTQNRDIRKMIIANSIMPLNPKFIEEMHLLNSNLSYDWISYSTALGLEHFYTKEIPNAKRYFKEKIKNNQVQYEIMLLAPKQNRFEPL